jgi:hypothetical protein
MTAGSTERTLASTVLGKRTLVHFALTACWWLKMPITYRHTPYESLDQPPTPARWKKRPRLALQSTSAANSLAAPGGAAKDVKGKEKAAEGAVLAAKSARAWKEAGALSLPLDTLPLGLNGRLSRRRFPLAAILQHLQDRRAPFFPTVLLVDLFRPTLLLRSIPSVLHLATTSSRGNGKLPHRPENEAR